MAVLGIGVDMVSVELFRQELARPSSSMLDEVLTPSELSYVRSAPDPAQSAAARFAAKEALYKALSGSLRWEDILECEVVHTDTGAPLFRVGNKARNYLKSLGHFNIHLSLTHEGDTAVAFVTVEVER